MSSFLDRLAQGERVLVIRLRSLGDCVLTTPALRLLKATRPDLEVGVAAEDRFREVFEGNPDVSAILAPRTRDVARFRPALCLNLHGGARSMTLTAASLARIRAGFSHHKGSFVYNVRIPRAQEIFGEERTVHTAEHLASAMFYLGAGRQPVPRARLFAEPSKAPRPYAVIHPVASQPDKTWTAEGFLAAAAHLSSDLEPVFIAGPGEDLAAFGRYRCVAGAPLSVTKSLLAGASLFLGNDSGPAHMAAAFGVPAVVLFGSSDPAIWAPWRTESQVIARRPIEDIRTPEAIQALEQMRVKR